MSRLVSRNENRYMKQREGNIIDSPLMVDPFK